MSKISRASYEESVKRLMFMANPLEIHNQMLDRLVIALPINSAITRRKNLSNPRTPPSTAGGRGILCGSRVFYSTSKGDLS